MKKLMNLCEGFEEMSMHTSCGPEFTQLRDYIAELKDDVKEFRTPRYQGVERSDEERAKADLLEYEIIPRLESILKDVK
jgi:hypothetical protein